MTSLSNILDRSADGQAVLSALRRKIVFQKYAKGDLLSEDALATEYGVSRSLIRHVLQVLINESLVSVLSNGRKEVLGFSLEYINNHYDLREALECRAAESILTSESRDLEPLKQAYNLLAEIKFCPADKFCELRDTNNSAIHCAIVKASGNPLLFRHYMMLEPMITTVTHLNASDEHHMEMDQRVYVRRHTILLDAALSLDPNLVELARSHVGEARHASLNILANFF